MGGEWGSREGLQATVVVGSCGAPAVSLASIPVAFDLASTSLLAQGITQVSLFPPR